MLIPLAPNTHIHTNARKHSHSIGPSFVSSLFTFIHSSVIFIVCIHYLNMRCPCVSYIGVYFFFFSINLHIKIIHSVCAYTYAVHSGDDDAFLRRPSLYLPPKNPFKLIWFFACMRMCVRCLKWKGYIIWIKSNVTYADHFFLRRFIHEKKKSKRDPNCTNAYNIMLNDDSK